MQRTLKLNKNKTSSLVKKRTKDLNRHLIKEDIQMANEYMKRCSTSYVIRELQFKITMRYTQLLEWPNSETLQTANAD